MHNSSPSSASSGSLKRIVLAGMFLLAGSTVQAQTCDTPTFATIPLSITAYTTANTCSPAVSFVATLANPTGVTLSYRLNGATLDSGLGTGSGHIFNRGITHITLSATRSCVTRNFFIDVLVKDTIKPLISPVANITVNAAAGQCGANVPYSISMSDNCPGCSIDLLESLGFKNLGQFQGHNYLLTPLKSQFNLVDLQAGSVGAHLASINSYAEDSFLNAVIPDTQVAWFGYTDRDVEGTWRWTDGSTSTYTNWCNTMPDDYLVEQDWAVLNSAGLAGNPGCWDDAHSPVFKLNGQPNNFVGVIELDVCGTNFVRTAGLASNSFFPLGTTKVTYVATDGSGNVDSLSFNVTVLGTCGPAGACTITVTPANNTYTGGVPTNIYLGYGPQSATLTASTPGAGTKSYLWTGPTSLLSCTTCQSPVFTPTAPGNYTFNSRVISGTDTFRCSVTFCVREVRGSVLGCGNPNQVRIVICHKTPAVNNDNEKTQCHTAGAIAAHLDHGDNLGECDNLCGRTARIIRGNTNVIGSEVKVYPNPANNAFFVEVPYFEKDASVTVSDLQGRVLESRNLNESNDHKLRFELGNNARGIYMIDVTYDDQRFRTKVVLQ